MAHGRGLVPLALAVGFGVLNGYVVFQPAYAEREAQKAFLKTHNENAPPHSDTNAQVPKSNNAIDQTAPSDGSSGAKSSE